MCSMFGSHHVLDYYNLHIYKEGQNFWTFLVVDF